MAEAHPAARWLSMAGGAAVALAFAVWWQLPAETPQIPQPEAPVTTETRGEGVTRPAASPPELQGGAAATLPRIPASGELSVSRGDLPGGADLAVLLELPEEAIGQGEPRPVRIVMEDGRTLETTASPAADDASGVRLEIDPDRLGPGRHLIEVKTAEKTHFPLRRYVLEVR